MYKCGKMSKVADKGVEYQSLLLCNGKIVKCFSGTSKKN